MTIKKQFEEIFNLLNENKTKKVSTIMDEAIKLMETKILAKTFKLDEEDHVTSIYCYYHKEWEDVSEVDYGKKSSTATGLNTMCKQGVSHWTKQQRVLKQSKADLLEKITSGEILPEDLPEEIASLEEASKVIVPLTD